jgi:hypothetical protein
MKFPALPARIENLHRFMGHQSPLWIRACAIALLLAVCAGLAWSALQSLRIHRELSDLQMQRNTLDAKAASRVLANSKPNKPLPKQVTSDRSARAETSLTEEQRRSLNTVIRQLNTPWQDLFDQLERQTPKDVALISIEPDARRASIRLQAEAKTLEALLAYAASLQQRGVLGRLTYSKHETNDQDSNKPIRLSVEYEIRLPARLAPMITEVSSMATQPLALEEAR